MKKLAFIGLMLTLWLLGCTNTTAVLPEKETKTIGSKQLLELAAERYGNYQYPEALYYYNQIITNYTSDNDEDNEARTWALYEIGYIYYIQNDYDIADSYFDKVLVQKTPTDAPRKLASKMKGKIQEKRKK